MINCPPTRTWRRVLGVVVCYALVLQLFFAAFATAVALFQENPTSEALVICHNTNTISPSTGDTGKPQKLSCLICAIAAAGGGLLPDAVVDVFTPRVLAGGVIFAKSIAISIRPPARDGRSRAPPRFA